MRRIGMMVAVAAAAGVMGCTRMTPQQQGTVSGAAIGAAAGAGIAAISGGSGWTGAAVGAVAGGVVGNIKGSRQLAIAQSKLTAQGQDQLPAEIRKKLGLRPGSVMEWDESGGEVVVRRAGQYTSGSGP